MTEHLDNQDLLGSGSHRWAWGPQSRSSKQFGTVLAEGEARIVLRSGARPGLIAGLLKAAGNDRAAADAALDALEAPLESLAKSGASCEWEDDSGRYGEHLVVIEYARLGWRLYGRTAGGGWSVWQQYRLSVAELSGGWL